MCPGGDDGWDDTFPRWQLWQSWHQAATWDAKPGHTKRLEISLFVALMPGCARLCTASKMGWRKVSGMMGLKTREEVSTKMGEPSSEISATRRIGDDLARWQSGQSGWAAASAARSTGDGEGGDLAVAGGTEDPEGIFTLVDP